MTNLQTQESTKAQREVPDGACVVCGRSVFAHFDDRTGRWKGCKGAAGATSYLLVPTRRRSDRALVETLQHANKPRTLRSLVDRMQEVAPAMRPPLYRYRATDRRVLSVEATDAIRDVYRVLQRSKMGITVPQVAKRARHPREATRRSLNWLVIHKHAVRHR